MDSVRGILSDCSRTLEFAESITSETLYNSLCGSVATTLYSAASQIQELLKDSAVPPPPPLEPPPSPAHSVTVTSTDPFGKYREFMGLIQNRVCARFPERTRRDCRGVATELYHKFKGEESVEDMVRLALEDLNATASTASAAAAASTATSSAFKPFRRVSLDHSPIQST